MNPPPKVKQRVSYVVESYCSVPAYVIIRPAYQDKRLVAFDLTDGDQLIASCESAKRLADWARENGADSVKHDYDLKLSEDEL